MILIDGTISIISNTLSMHIPIDCSIPLLTILLPVISAEIAADGELYYGLWLYTTSGTELQVATPQLTTTLTETAPDVNTLDAPDHDTNDDLFANLASATNGSASITTAAATPGSTPDAGAFKKSFKTCATRKIKCEIVQGSSPKDPIHVEDGMSRSTSSFEGLKPAPKTSKKASRLRVTCEDYRQLKINEAGLLDEVTKVEGADSENEDDPSKLNHLTSSDIDYAKAMDCLERHVTEPIDLQDQLRHFFESLLRGPLL
ncbi:hypothetical protein QM012_002617 [Aureobasidium pullulans]|uniref:Uncharacterized protein n=1 Tax=Aureobasidium pullulans TaxID=5580 RepID=A0ABR0TB98_AURPU